MKIIADENIPFVKDVFAHLGKVICCPGRQMNAKTLAGADALLVRSVTRVNRKLLENTAVKFVGTATIGTDHIDQQYLKQNNIVFADAAGSNSNSVAEYVITAMLTLAKKHNLILAGKRLGIIGLGNIGSKLEKKAEALNMITLANDPPLQRRSGNSKFVSLDQALQADFVSCHVPLTDTGPDATFHLLNERNLAQLAPQTVLINTSRGPVVDNRALLRNTDLGPIVLDVWENEPDINTDLLNKTAIATAHIAGYSFDGKANGTAMLHKQLCQFLEVEDTLKIKELMPPPPVRQITLATTGKTDQELLTNSMQSIYDIQADDARLRGLSKTKSGDRPEYFDHLRKTYPIRREAHNTIIHLEPHKPETADKLKTLGFQLT